MKVSILGWGVLAYLLALSPGLLANEDPVCQELREEMTTDELQSPRGLIAKIACPSLHTESNPLNATEKIQSLGHDELLSLCSTELSQLGYLIYQEHGSAISEETGSYKSDRLSLYFMYRLSPEMQTNELSFINEQYEKLETLPAGLTPVAPIHAGRFHGNYANGLYYSGEYLVQPTTGLPEDTVKLQWVDLHKLSSKELLDFSPMFFLAHHYRPQEALILIGELQVRSRDVDFVVAFNHALGVVAETYPMYFISPSVHYANVTFDSAIDINDVSSQMGLIASSYDDSGSPRKRPRIDF
ncbi:hypothetical protein IWQ62_002321 [Dispira parvispora]|uniref:Uncharacterized protein n=1 Tax=Dispira parvispora TaxID=1520584 RepID=A0A9W8AVX0_9FUNG|nr:hypothetical protein IWQ62_002321 [Dispira parvispora]